MQHSIVRYSQIDQRLFRLEAEFYNANSLLGIDCFSGDKIIDFAQYGTSKELNEEKSGVPTLRLNEFESLFIGTPKKYCNKINDETFNSLSLKKGDVLICRTNGNPKLVGKASVVLKDYQYAFASYLFKIRTDYNKILPAVLTIYLNSKIGRTEIEKHLMIGNQANFSPAKFREILIPKFGKKIQVLIDRCVQKSFKYHEQSKDNYYQAQKILLTELGLQNWQPKKQLAFIKNHSDTIQEQRIDADYYQPKYEQLIKKIKSYSGGWDTLGNLCQTKRGSLISDKYYDVLSGHKYIRGADFSGGTLSNDKIIFITKKFISKNEVAVNYGDIIFSLIGSVGETAIVTETFTDSYISNNVGKITCLKKINSEVLQVFLQSIVGQMYFLKYRMQTAQPKISNKDIEQFILPVLSKKKQTQIQKQVIKSFELRKKSQELLECSKKAVEIAIEKGESKALEWLNKRSLC